MVTSILILAAGNSRRMGRPKQLLRYQGKTLLERSVEAALASTFSPVVVVLGAYTEQILQLKLPAKARYVVNQDWQDGMSSSIRKGLTFLMDQEPTVENVIIAVADQVFISSDIFSALLAKKEVCGKSIIASRYADTYGTPVLFGEVHFPELLSLKGEQGAKVILKQQESHMESIDFELGYVDIDDEADYLRLI